MKSYSKIKQVTYDTTTLPTGKIKCYITGKLRQDTPEEHIRQRMARSIVEEYGYSKNDIELEYTIVLGKAKKRADIVVFAQDKTHIIENIKIIIEAKKESIKPTNKDNGIDQLKSYMAASINCKHGLWVGSEVQSFEKIERESNLEIIDALDIPLADGKFLVAHNFSDLVPATDVLKDVFKRCHNYIAANQGGSKETAFHEFLKMIFCKVFDEKYSSTPNFLSTLMKEEQRKALSQLKKEYKICFQVFAKNMVIFSEMKKK